MTLSGKTKWSLAGSAALVGVAIIAVISALRPQQTNTSSNWAGSASCRECHQTSHDLWENSRHGGSLHIYSTRFARNNLPLLPSTIEIDGRKGTATIDPERGVVVIEDSAGPQELQISHAVGGKNVFYFLTPLERGRLQTLPIAYDVQKKEWFNPALSGVRHFFDVTDDAPLEWTHRAFTFNTSCYRCHVSQASTNYDVRSDSYRSTWAEPGINCETCHGPGAEHIQTVRAHTGDTPIADVKIISTKRFNIEQTNAMCAPCHAKMTPLTEAFKPGDRYFDHYNLATLEDRDFYVDGRDLGENYTYTSWRLSPCVQSGRLSCLHCHASSGRFRFALNPDESCLPCHASHVQNPEPHTHHQQGSSGGRCIDCHMPTTEFARMKRSDHSMLPPTPTTTVQYGSPNACNLCHADRSPSWADVLVRAWSDRDYQESVVYRSRLVDDARKHAWSRLNEMLSYVTDKSTDEIYVTSLLRLLRFCDDDRKWPAIVKSLNSNSPLVRAAAAEALNDHVTAQSLPLLANAAGDEYRLVRIRAAGGLVGSRINLLASTQRRIIEVATGELIASLRSRADDFASHYNLGNYYLAQEEFQEAIGSYETAARLDPEDVAVWVNASFAYNAMGRNKEAEQSLRKALDIRPTNTGANLNLGLLLGEVGRLEEAEAALRAAFKSDSTCATAAYNLAVITADTRLDEAIQWSRKAVVLEPKEEKYADALATYLRRKRDQK